MSRSRCAAFYNSGPTTGIACAQVAFKCVTSPTDYPVNDGSFRNLKVILPPGRIVSADAPGADALVDDIPDDGGRHHLQGACQGDPRPGDRGPSRRSVRGAARRLLSRYRKAVHHQLRSARRRLGRQAQRGRCLRDRLHQRRRHPQQPERTARGEISDPGRKPRR